MVLKFHMQHEQTIGVQNDKIPNGPKSKMAVSAKIAKPIKSIFLQNGMVCIYLADILYEASMKPCF